ncbi:MAG: rhomboid family intramembrane serine protease [Pirellulales bacterium]
MPPFLQFDFRRTPVTLIIAGVALALEVVCTFDEPRRLYYLNDLRLAIWWQIWDGELWRPATTTLLHGNLLHALFNISWLLVFGQAIERWLGPLRTLGLYVLLAYTSMVPDYVWTEQTAVGLSGVLYGLVGFCWIGRGTRDDLAEVCTPAVMQLMLAWLLFCVVTTHFDLMPVANMAHVAGLVFGLLYGLAVFGPWRRAFQAAAAAATLAVLSLLYAAPWHEHYQYVQRLHRQRQLEREGVRLIPWPMKAPAGAAEDNRQPDKN